MMVQGQSPGSYHVEVSQAWEPEVPVVCWAVGSRKGTSEWGIKQMSYSKKAITEKNIVRMGRILFGKMVFIDSQLFFS